MKKIVCISDTHGLHKDMSKYNKLGEGDILIHSGDFSNIGRRDEIVEFFAWLHRQLKYFNNIIFVAGNHDRSMDPMFTETKSSIGHMKIYNEDDLSNPSVVMERPEWLHDAIHYLDKRIHYLENSGFSIDDLEFWGSPITPNFFEQYWAFNRTKGEKIAQYWDMIPESTDVLITHGPPYGILDMTVNGNTNVGCEELERAVNNYWQLPNLKLHVFGHIHEGYGIHTTDRTKFVNASVCDHHYVPKNAPIVVEL